MKEITDPIDVITCLAVESEHVLGDKYKEVLKLIKRARLLSSGVHYVKKNKTKWEEIYLLWNQLQSSDMTLKEKIDKIAYVTEMLPNTVTRIVYEIKKENPKIKIRIDEKSLFDHMENSNETK